MKTRSAITYLLLIQSFWNFAHSTAKRLVHWNRCYRTTRFREIWVWLRVLSGYLYVCLFQGIFLQLSILANHLQFDVFFLLQIDARVTGTMSFNVYFCVVCQHCLSNDKAPNKRALVFSNSFSKFTYMYTHHGVLKNWNMQMSSAIAMGR